MNKYNRKMNRLIMIAAVIAVLLVALPLILVAQGELSLRWSNVSSGYGISSGDGFRVAGTGGEIDSGAPQSGDGFSMTGGFWSGVDEPPPIGSTPEPVQFRLYLPSTIK